MSWRPAQAIAALTPRPLLGAAVRAVYPRIEPELGELDRFVPRGGTAVDVGGWFGPWTQRLLTRADRVVTVEADPALAALLARTFPRARVIAAAASDHRDGCTLWSPAGGAIIGVSSVEHGRADAHATPVPTVRLDDLGLRDVRFVKLDIEGHEAAALRGAKDTIRRDRPVLLVELETRHGTLGPVQELLDGWGYRGFVGEVPLEEFDLPAHQAAHAYQLDRAFPVRALRPGDRYVNSVLFRHCSS